MTGMPSGEGPALNVVNYTDDTPGRGDGSISQADVPSRMDFDDALARLERGNAILFRMDSPCLAQLAGRLSSADRRTVVLWGLECAGRVADRLRGMFPEEGGRPRPSAIHGIPWRRSNVAWRPGAWRRAIPIWTP